LSRAYLAIPNFEKAEFHAREGRALLERRKQVFSPEEYAGELSRIDDALREIENKKREVGEAQVP